MGEQFVGREQQVDLDAEYTRVPLGELKQFAAERREVIQTIDADKQDIDQVQIPHFSQILDSLQAESAALGVERATEVNQLQAAERVIKVQEDRLRDDLAKKARRAQVQQARRTHEMMTGSISQVPQADLDQLTQAPVRPSTGPVRTQVPVPAPARMPAPEAFSDDAEDMTEDDDNVYVPDSRRSKNKKAEKKGAPQKINLKEIATSPSGSTSVGWRERMPRYRPGRKTVISVASATALIAAGIVVVGGDDDKNIAEKVSFGQGFDDAGVSETAHDIADVSFSAEVGVYMGRDDKGPIMSPMPFTWNEDETERVIRADAEELSTGLLRVNGADIMADVYDPNEPTALTIEAGEEEGKAVAVLDLSQLEGQISIRNQDGDFYKADTVDDEGIEVLNQMADLDKDKPAEERDRYERENVDIWVENMKKPETHEALAYEALSSLAEGAVNPETVSEPEITEYLEEVAKERLSEELKKHDPDTEYTIDTRGSELPDLKVAGIVQRNVEDDAELKTRETEQGIQYAINDEDIKINTTGE